MITKIFLDWLWKTSICVNQYIEKKLNNWKGLCIYVVRCTVILEVNAKCTNETIDLYFFIYRWLIENRLHELKFARQKLASCYFSAAATLYQPALSDARMSWAKNGVLTTVVDDFFDVGGSTEELLNLIALVKRCFFLNPCLWLGLFYFQQVHYINYQFMLSIKKCGVFMEWYAGGMEF